MRIRSREQVFLLIGLILCIVGAATILLGVARVLSEARRGKALQEFGAVITGLDDGKTTVAYQIQGTDYRYTFSYENSSLKTGDEIKILADPSKPEEAYLKQGPSRWISLGLGLLLVLVGTAALINVQRVRGTHRRLAETGRCVTATITDYRGTYSIREYVRNGVVFFLQDAEGNRYESEPVLDDDPKGRIGTTCRVYVDRTDASVYYVDILKD